MSKQDKYEKVIKGLKSCMGEGQCCGMCDSCPYNTDKMRCDLATLHQDALELLKAQEPVKVKDAIWPNRGVFGKCGVCNSPLPVIEGIKSKFCCMCGQAVKWDG